MDEQRKYLVCGTIRRPDAETALCAECGATVYPSPGSLKKAEEQGFVPLCIGCEEASAGYRFAGFMDRGEMMPGPMSALLFHVFKMWQKKKNSGVA